MRERSLLSYDKRRRRQEKGKQERADRRSSSAIFSPPSSYQAMEEKSQRAGRRKKSPFLSPPSSSILSLPFRSLLVLTLCRNGKKGRKERGDGRHERARDGKERRVEERERKDRGRLKRTTPPPSLAATSPLLLCLPTQARLGLSRMGQEGRTRNEQRRRTRPCCFLKLLLFSSPPLSVIVLSLLLSLSDSLFLSVFSLALVLLLPFSDSLIVLLSFALLPCLLPCVSSSQECVTVTSCENLSQ